MSNQHNEELKVKILDEITSMTTDEFITACEFHGIRTNIDNDIYKLVNIEFEDRSN